MQTEQRECLEFGLGKIYVTFIILIDCAFIENREFVFGDPWVIVANFWLILYDQPQG